MSSYSPFQTLRPPPKQGEEADIEATARPSDLAETYQTCAEDAGGWAIGGRRVRRAPTMDEQERAQGEEP